MDRRLKGGYEDAHHPRIAVVMSGFPRRSETFALHELLALHEHGMLHSIFSTKPGDGNAPHPGVECLLPYVHCLPDGGVAEQATALVDVLRARSEPLPHGIHGYFAHRPGAIAAEAARHLRLPFSFGMHAHDARKTPHHELAERARSAAAVIACNTDVRQALETAATPIQLVPHGVDLQRFPAQPMAWSNRSTGPLQILAVGRLVPKKGLDVLVTALLHTCQPMTLSIVGDGPEQEYLAALIDAHHLHDQVRMTPSVSHAALPALFAAADVVAIPSVIDSSGDRDGLPNVLLEALASARPVVAAATGAIEDALIHGETGVVVPSGDPIALAAALDLLAEDPALRQRLATQGRRHVEDAFALEGCTAHFVEVMGAIYGC